MQWQTAELANAMKERRGATKTLFRRD